MLNYAPVMRISTATLFLLTATVAGSSSFGANPPSTNASHFIGIEDFSKFKQTIVSHEVVLTSPELKAPIAWDEMVPSWNATAPTGTFLKIEARGLYPDRATKFYTLGLWSEDTAKFPRESVKGQKDSDGNVSTDTLMLKETGAELQLRITLGNSEEKIKPKLNFIGLSFLNSKAKTTSLPPNKKAWGKIIETPERSQNSYPEEEGWCSPTSLAMVLMRWSAALQRPDLNVDVRECAAGVFDKNYGTGNWPFNTAYAGKFPGLRGYVTRFTDIAELEDWISAGIPVIISAPFHLLESGRKDTGSGHVITCIGFTETGDVVINDPATNLNQGQKVRHIYKRENVINAWKKSNNTVYLIYPTSAKIPKNRLGHWEKK